MLTLDDVIDNFEKACDLELRCENCSGCLSQENGCPYDGAESIPDALHYLKEYRSDKVHWEADRKSYQGFVDSYIKSRDKHQAAVIELKHKEKEVNEILTDYVALKQWWTEQQVNPPLSWDELKAMEGKPVWIELLGNGHWKGWDVVGGFAYDDFGEAMVTVHNDDYYKLDLGKTWQAYRKERK